MNITTKKISLLLFADLAIIVTLLKESVDVSRFETSHSNSQSPHAESLKELAEPIVSSDEQSNPGYSQIKIGSGQSQLKTNVIALTLLGHEIQNSKAMDISSFEGILCS